MIIITCHLFIKFTSLHSNILLPHRSLIRYFECDAYICCRESSDRLASKPNAFISGVRLFQKFFHLSSFPNSRRLVFFSSINRVLEKILLPLPLPPPPPLYMRVITRVFFFLSAPLNNPFVTLGPRSNEVDRRCQNHCCPS